jgi:hypothetical protein
MGRHEARTLSGFGAEEQRRSRQTCAPTDETTSRRRQPPWRGADPHGLRVAPDDALDLAVELEGLAELYWRALQVGDRVLLTAEEMAEARTRFADYR